MAYNLIEERWIPVRRKSGKVEAIAPWQIAETQDPPIRVESPRPDFDAALLEMLIGLVQTVMTPEDEVEWKEIYREGIDPKTLHKKMEKVKEAFFLDGDGPRFFQDLDVHKHPKAERKPINSLLIEQGTAGDSQLFAKTGVFKELGRPMAAAAILTMQQFAPSGGSGIRTSLRGGGPLSVTIQDVSLWKTVWCNVLNAGDLAAVPGNRRKQDLPDVFPWMAKTRTSEVAGSATFPDAVNPLQHYWGLPRRYRLCFDSEGRGRCAVSGEEGPSVTEVWSRKHGVNYEGPFLHPLTAYDKRNENEPPIPKKGSSGLSYRDWPRLHLGSEKAIPPMAIEAFYRNERGKTAKAFRTCVRGYEIENNIKAVRFFDAESPMLYISASLLGYMRGEASMLVEASDSARLTLLQQVKAAWSDRPKDQGGDVQARTDAAFWSATEADFYQALRGVAESLAKDAAGDAERGSVKTEYVRRLQAGALQVFDELCPSEADLGGDGLARLVRARKDLRWFTRAEELAKKVGLAAPEEKPKPPKKNGKSSPKARRKEGQP